LAVLIDEVDASEKADLEVVLGRTVTRSRRTLLKENKFLFYNHAEASGFPPLKPTYA